ncbi:putative DNA-binding domain-containing protein [Hydrogenophaga taeniospiralis]|uniref:HvfC/BufC N-terminal domain-containing protein n=1 Tax=Hydrogenophaga taeniospiralis TaxID=65656 RepID=UPI001CFB48E5|nr:DNA-binding domain-containing protein [Hydrogenophaga taeniospiralis]MCB4366930.1 putative DNA-binding domain-containing protein [Hydrogenophaga taeniospiralis]
MSTQHSWAQALLDPAQAAPSGLVTWNHSDPQRRLAVHRNNVMVSLVDALAHTFPVTQELVGETFFRAMAQVFVRAHPPRTRVLSHYGAELPGFIARFAPAASLPYLADVAQLEMLRLQALHAADARAMDAQAIAAVMHDARALPTLRWRLAPSLHLLRSAHAAVSLWAAHQEGSGLALEDIDPAQAESALVFRSGLDVMVWQTPPGMAELVVGLLLDDPFGQALERALAAEPDFDLTQALATLIRHELLIGVEHAH